MTPDGRHKMTPPINTANAELEINDTRIKRYLIKRKDTYHNFQWREKINDIITFEQMNEFFYIAYDQSDCKFRIRIKRCSSWKEPCVSFDDVSQFNIETREWWLYQNEMRHMHYYGWIIISCVERCDQWVS